MKRDSELETPLEWWCCVYVCVRWCGGAGEGQCSPLGGVFEHVCVSMCVFEGGRDGDFGARPAAYQPVKVGLCIESSPYIFRLLAFHLTTLPSFFFLLV